MAAPMYGRAGVRTLKWGQMVTIRSAVGPPGVSGTASVAVGRDHEHVLEPRHTPDADGIRPSHHRSSRRATARA